MGRRFLLLIAGPCMLMMAAQPTYASPSTAVSASQTAAPACTMVGNEWLVGAQFVNNTTVNGTWYYFSGVSCTANVGDIAIGAQLLHNGVVVASAQTAWKGSPHSSDYVFPSFACAQCRGSWTVRSGQFLKAPAGALWTASAGCTLYSNGLYEYCQQESTVVVA